MTKILINAQGIKDDVLEETIEVLEKATDCKIIWRQMYVLESENMKALKILHSLFGGEVDENNPAHPERAEKPKKKIKGGKKGRVMGRWKALTGAHKGEEFAGQSIRKLIENGELVEGDRLNSPKGMMVISNGTAVSVESPEPVTV